MNKDKELLRERNKDLMWEKKEVNESLSLLQLLSLIPRLWREWDFAWLECNETGE